MRLSITVMAHESRSDWFPYLREKLGDVPFSIDSEEKKLGIWENCKRAWQLHDMTADYCITIQDDAIICDDFEEKAKNLIQKHGHNAYQFFLGRRVNVKIPPRADVYRGPLMGGVAICLPSNMVGEMLMFCDQERFAAMADDTRIKQFLLQKRMQVVYPLPCLIDHRIGTSVAGNGQHGDRPAVGFVDRPKLPRVIHQIWIGPKKPPMGWINTWRNIKGWEHKLWTEKEIDNLEMKNRDLYEYFMRKKIYYGASDVVRLEILDQFGGLYIDADTRRLKPINDLFFLESNFFAVKANKKKGVSDTRVANGVMGSQPGHPLVLEYIRRMGEAKQVEPVWDTIGGTMLTDILYQYKDDPSVLVIEPYWFYPWNSVKQRHPKWREAVAAHYWGSTHNLYKER